MKAILNNHGNRCRYRTALEGQHSFTVNVHLGTGKPSYGPAFYCHNKKKKGEPSPKGYAATPKSLYYKSYIGYRIRVWPKKQISNNDKTKFEGMGYSSWRRKATW